jgi:putative endonuclease
MESTYYVYVLKSDFKDFYYKGMTNNLERRLKEHNSGQCKSTKIFRPFKIVYKEVCENRILARKREKYLKSAAGRKFLKKILE